MICRMYSIDALQSSGDGLLCAVVWNALIGLLRRRLLFEIFVAISGANFEDRGLHLQTFRRHQLWRKIAKSGVVELRPLARTAFLALALRNYSFSPSVLRRSRPKARVDFVRRFLLHNGSRGRRGLMMAILSSNVYLPVKYQAFPWKESQEEWISPKLKSIAEQLRRYKTPSSSAEEEGPGGVTSSVGMPASVASQNDLKVFPTKQRAAVLVCLHQSPEGELRVILTKRAGSLSSHSGEVALPGGKRDDEDVNDAATALREAREEIGLEPSHVRVVGHLEPFLSKHLLSVIPVIGLLDDMRNYNPTPNPGEVESVFEAPLEMFLKESESHWWQEREWLGVKYRVHFFNYTTPAGDKFLIWGLTASILIRAASLIFQREPEFVEFGPDFEAIVKSSEGVGFTPDSTDDRNEKK